MRMTKTTLMGAALATGLFASGAQADLIITGIMDGTLSGAVPRAVEIYTTEAITDFEAEYQAQYSANTNDYSNMSTSFGSIAAGSFFYITNSTDGFEDVFGEGKIVHQNGGLVPTGNDSFRLLLKADSSVIDEVYTKDSNDDIYQDSYMYRNNGTGPDGAWTPANWSIPGNNTLDGLSASEIAATVPFGTYQIPEPGSLALLGLGGLAMLTRRRSA